jgi:hypothetical protein
MTNTGGVPDPRIETGKIGQTPRKPSVIRVLVPQPHPPVVKVSTTLPSHPTVEPVSLPPESAQTSAQTVVQAQDWTPQQQTFQPSQVSSVPVDEPASPRQWLRIHKSWQFWAVLAVLAATGIGGISIALLLKLPALPNCPAIFWPTASASLRLYCAEVAANKQTVNDLLEAIALVNSLPADHPLRSTVNHHIEKWSSDILNLAEASFNKGKLEEAIATANRIPATTSAHAAIEARIQRWQATWKQAESIYQQAEKALTDQNLQKAFTLAVQLLDIDNTYWQTTKYQELSSLITAYRQDGSKLDKARSLARRGGLENLLAAIKAAEEISDQSPLHAQVQKAINEFGRKMLDLAESTLGQQDADEAIAIVRQIPPITHLDDEIQDFIQLAQAQQQAWSGTVEALQSAILQARQLEQDRPLYDKAQQLISRWQLETQDISHLDQARDLAQSGNGDLAAAIAEAELVPRGNPRRQEARRQIAEWTGRIESREDQPYLDQADQLSQGGDITSLQAAIDQANRIGAGRSLSAEARRRVEDWTAQIQNIQDRPYLDRARQTADGGNLPDAIALAQQIQSGRSLYREAQTDIRRWRDRIQSQTQLQQAYQAAAANTPTSLVSAIRVAQQISSDSSLRAEADRMISRWSQSLLTFAQAQAEVDLNGAIATAESIPPRTDAYAAAQLQLQSWRQQLAPSPEDLLNSFPASP